MDLTGDGDSLLAEAPSGRQFDRSDSNYHNGNRDLNNSKLPNHQQVVVTREDSSKFIQQQILNNIKNIEQRIKIEKRKQEIQTEIKSLNSKINSSNEKFSASSKDNSKQLIMDSPQLAVQYLQPEIDQGINKALDIIEQHEKEQLEAKRLKKEQDLQKLQSIEENFKDEIEPRNTVTSNREHLSFSQSAILVCADPDNNSNVDTKDEISGGQRDELSNNQILNDLEIQEETALLIESIMHPDDLDAEPEVFENSDHQNLLLMHQQLLMAENHAMSIQNHRFNVYGQRYHPAANPYDYQYRQQQPYPHKGNFNHYSTMGTQASLKNRGAAMPYENRYILQEDSQEFYYDQQGIYNMQKGVNAGNLRGYNYQDDQYQDGRLHYLKDAENGLNTDHHKDFANNQIVLQGLKNMYEEQGAGIASNFMTFFKIQRNLFGFSLLVAPMCIQEFGIELFFLGIAFAGILNTFSVWLLSKAEVRFRNEFFMITNLHDLTYLCFGDWVIVLQQILRIVNCFIILVVINLYLSIQTDQFMCQTLKGYQCNIQRDYFIRIAVNILILVIILSGNAYQLRFRKMVSVFSSLLMLLGLGLAIFHSYIMFKNQSKAERDQMLDLLNVFGKGTNDTFGNATAPIKVAATSHQAGIQSQGAQGTDSLQFTQFLKFCSFVSIAMTLFDGNYHILLVKNEMQKPHSFSKMAVTSITTYCIICFLVGFFSYLGMGQKLLSPITENQSGDYQILGSKAFMLDSNAIYYFKIICILCMFASTFLYSMNVFISLQKINRILMQDKRNMGHFVQNQNHALSFNTAKSDDFMSKSQHGTGHINFLVQFAILTSVVVASNRLSQKLDDDKGRINKTIELALQLCGGLISTTLLILFPILIFNKSYRQSHNYKYWIIVNWCIFGLSIAVGAVGCYNGYQELVKNISKSAIPTKA